MTQHAIFSYSCTSITILIHPLHDQNDNCTISGHHTHHWIHIQHMRINQNSGHNAHVWKASIIHHMTISYIHTIWKQNKQHYIKLSRQAKECLTPPLTKQSHRIRDSQTLPNKFILKECTTHYFHQKLHTSQEIFVHLTELSYEFHSTLTPYSFPINTTTVIFTNKNKNHIVTLLKLTPTSLNLFFSKPSQSSHQSSMQGELSHTHTLTKYNNNNIRKQESF